MKPSEKKPVPSDAPLTVRDLEPGDWPVIERLFGARGACGGCWCMYWRVPGGKTWEAKKGKPNQAAFRRLVRSEAVCGALAFAGDDPVGWCNLGPRSDFPKLQKSRVLRTDREDAWAITCFYVPARWRGRGVARVLLSAAVELARREGAKVLEGYPVRPSATKVPAAFAWTGVPRLFEQAGFRDVSPDPDGRPIFRKTLRRRPA